MKLGEDKRKNNCKEKTKYRKKSIPLKNYNDLIKAGNVK